MKAFHVPTPEELIQKTLSDTGQHEQDFFIDFLFG
jgi:hypothetical protein